MSLLRGSGRGRSFLRFLFAVAWLAIAYVLSEKAAHGFLRGSSLSVFFPLLRNLFDIFLLILGYSYMELSWNQMGDPLPSMGLARRPGTASEFARGAALGWGMVTAVFLVIVLAGNFYVSLHGNSHAWAALALQVLILAAGSLAAEIAFRGYPFQQLIRATGPVSATLLSGLFFGLLRIETPGATAAAMWISAMAAVILSIAYLRTRALWLCWGLHFAWIASIGILFGQPLAHNRQASSVVRSYVDGPTWLTGGEYGPEASIVTLIALWIGLYLVVRITRDLASKYTQAELGPAVMVTSPSISPIVVMPATSGVPPAPPAENYPDSLRDH